MNVKDAKKKLDLKEKVIKGCLGVYLCERAMVNAAEENELYMALGVTSVEIAAMLGYMLSQYDDLIDTESLDEKYKPMLRSKTIEMIIEVCKKFSPQNFHEVERETLQEAGIVAPDTTH